jgi:hypothetical protein
MQGPEHMDIRLNDLTENFGGGVKHSVTIGGRAWVQRLDDCLDEPREV